MRHFAIAEDLTRAEYAAIVRRSGELRSLNGRQLTELARGSVIGGLFFDESLRTSALVHAAVGKLGGTYLPITARISESPVDVARSVLPYCNLAVLRTNDYSMEDFTTFSPIPLINGMCRGSDHALSVVWQLATLAHLGLQTERIRVGIYGQTSHCRPYLALQKALALFSAQIFHDPIIDGLANPPAVVDFIRRQANTTYQLMPLCEFSKDVDLLLVSDGLPNRAGDETLFAQYTKQYVPLTSSHFETMGSQTRINIMLPRKLEDGRTTVSDDFLRHPQVYNDALMTEGLWGTMALISFLLEDVLRTSP